MKRIPSFLAVAILVCAVPAIAGETTEQAGTEVKLTGFFTDEWCGAANANEMGVGCAKACAKKGSAMAIYANGKLYKIYAKDKQKAVDNLGTKVTVKGVIQEDGTLKIASIAKSDKEEG